MNKKLFYLLLTWVLLIGFISCDKDDPEPDPTPIEVLSFTVAAPEFDKWHYFSFETGAIVPATDVGDYESSKDKTNWDLAFNRANVRTNSGASGLGMGGSIKTDKTDFDDVSEIPTSGYTIDVEHDIAWPSMQETATHSVNMILQEGITSQGMPPTWAISENIFIVKTADAKYALLKFKDYSNDEGQGGHIKFEYKYPVE
jgi:hypothetical protein